MIGLATVTSCLTSPIDVEAEGGGRDGPDTGSDGPGRGNPSRGNIGADHYDPGNRGYRGGSRGSVSNYGDRSNRGNHTTTVGSQALNVAKLYDGT